MWLNNLHFRDRHDEFTACVAIRLLLREDFVSEIPREQQCVIKFEFEQFLRRHNRDVRAGSEAAMFVGAAVGDKIQRVRADAVVIQQRAAFGRRAVSDDALAFLLQLGEQCHEVVFDSTDLIAEAFVVAECGDAFARFFGQQIRGGLLDAVRARVPREQSQ